MTDTQTKARIVEAPNGVHLPFRVRIVRTEDHLDQAVAVRANSYGKHHPEVAELLSSAEDADRSQLVLLAEEKITRAPLGTMRIETNTTNALPVEALLPENSIFTARTLAYVTRLAVTSYSEATLVKLALYKALLRYCLACQIDWAIVTARPPIDRQYSRLGFTNVFGDERLVEVPWSNNIPMKIMAMETLSCEPSWRESNHPVYPFMFCDYTPDIEIFKSLSGSWARPRTRAATLPPEKEMERLFTLPLV